MDGDCGAYLPPRPDKHHTSTHQFTLISIIFELSKSATLDTPTAPLTSGSLELGKGVRAMNVNQPMMLTK